MNNTDFYRWPCLIIAILGFSVFLSCAMAISEGDSIDDVYKTFGKPNGVMRRGSELFLAYDRGHVIIKDGKVTSIKMISRREHAEQERARKKQLALEKARIERETAERITRGTAKKAETLENEEFAELPPRERLGFWRNFQAEFPEISVDKEIKEISMEIHAEELERINGEIEELKQQITEAETNSRTAPEWRVRRQARQDLPELEKKLENAVKEKTRLEQGL